MFIKQKDEVFIFDGEYSLLENLENDTFLLQYDGVKGFYLRKIPSLKLDTEVYGDHVDFSERVLTTFSNIDVNLGVLLTGYKGMGKTILSKLICIKSNLPVIIVPQKYEGGQLHSFLNSITQKCVVLIDEFEKLYKDDEQEILLTILDGAYITNKLFILTSNTKELNPFLLNRPGRIRYHKHFNGMSRDFIEEIVDKLLDNLDNRDEVIEFALDAGQISIDSLVTLIEEINLYNETPQKAAKYLNINIELCNYDVNMILDGQYYQTSFYGHPYQSDEFYIEYSDDKVDRWFSRRSYKVKLKDMVRSREDNGDITLSSKNDTITFRKVTVEKDYF